MAVLWSFGTRLRVRELRVLARYAADWSRGSSKAGIDLPSKPFHTHHPLHPLLLYSVYRLELAVEPELRLAGLPKLGSCARVVLLRLILLLLLLLLLACFLLGSAAAASLRLLLRGATASGTPRAARGPLG